MRYFPASQKGQSLVEVLVAMTVTALVVTALVIIILNSLKNSQFSKNQAVATKYAQEAVADIEAIKATDGNITFQTLGTPQNFSSVWAKYFSDPNSPSTSPCQSRTSDSPPKCGFEISYSSGGGTTEVSLTETTSGDFSAGENLGNGFSRKILIWDDDSPEINCFPGSSPCNNYNIEKNIEVDVEWIDSSGTHRSNIQTVVTRY